MNTSDLIAQIKASADCRELFRRFWPDHHRERGNSVCPFHEDLNPSLSVDQAKAHCFAEGKSWDAIDLYELGTGCSKKEAIGRLTSELGLVSGSLRTPNRKGSTPPPGKPKTLPVDHLKRWKKLTGTPLSDDAVQYLERRKLPASLLAPLKEECLIGFNPKWKAIAFPVTDAAKKRLLGIQFIPIDGADKKFAKGTDSKDGFFRFGDGGDYTVVTEAVIDALSVHAACPGLSLEVVSIYSAATWRKVGQIGGPSPVLFFDNDPAGIKATCRALRAFPGKFRVVDWALAANGCKDANDLLKHGHAAEIDRMVRLSALRSTGEEIIRQLSRLDGMVKLDADREDFEKFKAEMGSVGRAEPTKPGHGMLRLPPMPKVFSAAELEGMTFPDPVWIVPAIIPEGLTILAGKPKLGKSYMALNIGLALACGGMALGRVPVTQQGVLYLSLEDRQRRLQARTRETFSAQGWPSALHMATEWPRVDQGGIPLLQEFLEAHQDIKLVIVDVLARFRGRANSPSKDLYLSDYMAIESLKSVADVHGVSLLVIHHTRKTAGEDPLDEISGSTGLSGASDTLVVLRRERGKVVLYVRGRDVEEQELALDRDPAGGWVLVGHAEEVRLGDEQRLILDTLQNLGGRARFTEIVQASGKKKPALHALLGKLMSKSLIRQIEYGIYELSMGVNGGERGESTKWGERGESSPTREGSVPGPKGGESSRLGLERAGGQDSVDSPHSAVPVEDDAEVF